ncbi:MAG: polysaccharide pyruvyl transferase family protein [Desulfobacterales bacterium]
MNRDNKLKIQNKRILILQTGTYCSKNKGDAAMQQVFAAELKRNDPKVEVIIGSPFPEIDTSFYSPIKVIKSRRRNLLLATLNWLILEFLKILDLSPKRWFMSEEVDFISRADLIVDLSGDMLTEDYGPLIGFSHFLPLLQAQALRRPVIICAQSVGPFRRLKPLARRIFSNARLITVRESFSYKLLRELNPSKIKPLLTADLAFLLPTASDSRIEELFSAEGIPQKKRTRLGVSVNALLANSANRHLKKDKNDNLDVFAEALDMVIEHLGVEVMLVPHVFGPRQRGDDRLPNETLKRKMKHLIYAINGEYRPEEMKGIIASCDAFVGFRMHANISALDSNVPVLAVGYSHKTRGILNELRLGDWAIPSQDLTTEKLFCFISQLFTEAPTYRKHLSEQLPNIRERAQTNISIILKEIKPA